MNECVEETIEIAQLYADLKQFMKQSQIEYKLPSGEDLNFSKSDVDFLLRRHEDLGKIKAFILNYGIKIIVRQNNKNHFYFVVIDNQQIHAFDFTVGLMSPSGLICSGDYLFQSSEFGIDFNNHYAFLKNAAKFQTSHYVIKESKKSVPTRGISFIKKISRYVLNIFSKKSPGLSVVLLGADGSGKSSVSDFIQSSFAVDRKLFQLKTIYFKPNVFKIKPDRKLSEYVNIPHSHSTYSSFLSVAKVFYVFLNYILYWPILQLRKKSGHLIIFDRHFYDILIDPKRYRINKTGLKCAFFLVNFIAKPDLVIILSSDVESLSKRKPGEVEEELLTKLNAHYKDFLIKNVNIFHIVNNGSLEDLKQKVLKIILKEL